MIYDKSLLDKAVTYKSLLPECESVSYSWMEPYDELGGLCIDLNSNYAMKNYCIVNVRPSNESYLSYIYLCIPKYDELNHSPRPTYTRLYGSIDIYYNIDMSSLVTSSKDLTIYIWKGAAREFLNGYGDYFTGTTLSSGSPNYEVAKVTVDISIADATTDILFMYAYSYSVKGTLIDCKYIEV